MKRYFTTVVGGRPEIEQEEVSLPRAWEVLFKKAKVDDVFRSFFLADPVAAAQELKLSLTSGETAMLRSWNPATLGLFVEKVAVPARHASVFRYGSAAAMLAVVMAASVIHPVNANGGVEARYEYPLGEQMFQDMVFTPETEEGRLGILQTALEVYHSVHGEYLRTEDWYDTSNELQFILYELCDSCDFVRNADFMETLPARYIGLVSDGAVVDYKLESTDRSVYPPVDTNTHRFFGYEPLKIIYPEDGFSMILPAGSETVEIEVVAEHADTNTSVNWYVQRGLGGIRTTVGTHAIKVSFFQGQCRVTAVDENGYGDSLDFTVEAE